MSYFPASDFVRRSDLPKWAALAAGARENTAGQFARFVSRPRSLARSIYQFICTRFLSLVIFSTMPIRKQRAESSGRTCAEAGHSEPQRFASAAMIDLTQ